MKVIRALLVASSLGLVAYFGVPAAENFVAPVSLPVAARDHTVMEVVANSKSDLPAPRQQTPPLRAAVAEPLGLVVLGAAFVVAARALRRWTVS